VYQRNALLRERLIELIGELGPHGVPPSKPEFRVVSSPKASPDPSAPVHAVVTVNEINYEHGTGPLVKRIFEGRRGMFSIRSRDHWGTQDFGDWHVKMSQEGCTRPEWFRRVLRVLAGRNVKSVTCVPFLAEELMTSIAIKESFDAQMCVYIMDDQNVAVNVIPDDLMREFLEKCSLRLATHAELRDAYARKYGLPFYILPAIVPAAALGRNATAPSDRVTVGILGSGGRAIFETTQYPWFDNAVIVAVCDAQETRRMKAKDTLEKLYAEQRPERPNRGIRMYRQFHDLLAQKDIDAVYIASPDHWHVSMLIPSLEAGKHVHCEKPLGVSIELPITTGVGSGWLVARTIAAVELSSAAGVWLAVTAG